MRALIQQLVAAEDAAKPLSDSQLSQMLEEQGIQVGQQLILYRRISEDLPIVIVGNSVVIDLSGNDTYQPAPLGLAAGRAGIDQHTGTAPQEFVDRMRAEGRLAVTNTGDEAMGVGHWPTETSSYILSNGTLTVTGSGFVSGATVRWNGVNRTTTFVSATQLTAAIPASDLVTAGTGYKKATVTVGWTDARGSARSLAISTVLTDYTP